MKNIFRYFDALVKSETAKRDGGIEITMLWCCQIIMLPIRFETVSCLLLAVEWTTLCLGVTNYYLSHQGGPLCTFT